MGAKKKGGNAKAPAGEKIAKVRIHSTAWSRPALWKLPGGDCVRDALAPPSPLLPHRSGRRPGRWWLAWGHRGGALCASGSGVTPLSSPTDRSRGSLGKTPAVTLASARGMTLVAYTRVCTHATASVAWVHEPQDEYLNLTAGWGAIPARTSAGPRTVTFTAATIRVSGGACAGEHGQFGGRAAR